MNESQHDVATGAAPADSIPSFSTGLNDYYRRTLKNLRENLPGIARQLQDAGVARVFIQYDGCGDSGQIEGITLNDASGAVMPVDTVSAALQEELANLLYDLLEVRHPGWENNDGAFGELEWDLSTNDLQHSHNSRFTDYETTEYEGL